MAKQIRFHLDENVNPQIAKALEKMGIEVSISSMSALRTSADEDQWDFVKREGRVLITHDSDFLRLASNDGDHPGIIFCKQKDHSLGKIILECSSIHANVLPQEMRGRVEYI